MGRKNPNFVYVKKHVHSLFLLVFMIIYSVRTTCQTISPDSTVTKKLLPHGIFWGSAFADFTYKANADTVNGGRGSTQYSGVPKNRTLFQFRRIYIGYNYFISAKFSTELLLASEDDSPSGDLLVNNKFASYIKLANIRWKNIWNGTDIVFGQVSSPAFSLSSEKIWAYRSIEKTVSDIRRTPSFDLGVTVQGHFIATNDNYGYNIMVGNGQGAKPETDAGKWFYADVYARLFDKKFLMDVYADYNRMQWNSKWHHSRNMIKGFVAYSVPKITFGVEAFINTLQRDNIATKNNGSKDTITTKAKAISLFTRGRIYKDKLGFFARYDSYDPSENINNSLYNNNNPLTVQYDPNTKENFITAGLDYTPDKNVHIMPNIWYNRYKNTGPKDYGTANKDHDLVFRLTCHWIFDPR